MNSLSGLKAIFCISLNFSSVLVCFVKSKVNENAYNNLKSEWRAHKFPRLFQYIFASGVSSFQASLIRHIFLHNKRDELSHLLPHALNHSKNFFVTYQGEIEKFIKDSKLIYKMKWSWERMSKLILGNVHAFEINSGRYYFI